MQSSVQLGERWKDKVNVHFLHLFHGGHTRTVRSDQLGGVLGGSNDSSNQAARRQNTRIEAVLPVTTLPIL